ncbi:YegS/Rv2252/BmrU family lipid kinase [Natronospora cellulosivora (SeqCode)]
MKRCKLLYNPMSGNKSFARDLDSIVKKLQENGYIIDIYRSMAPGNIIKGVENIRYHQYENIIVAGGDGSLNQVINALRKEKIKIPLAILPAGTANDIANYLNMPNNFEKCIDLIANNTPIELDLAKINNSYFINVCFIGEFSNIPEETPEEFKTIFGKLAYYINGLKELPNIKAIPLRIEGSSRIIEEELFLSIIINTNRAGGFKNLCPPAKTNDGLFDFIGIKYNGIHKLPAIFMKILQGEHLSSPDVIYFQDSYFKIKNMNSNTSYFCDIDGERGPQLPLEIRIKKEELQMYSNR